MEYMAMIYFGYKVKYLIQQIAHLFNFYSITYIQ